MLKTTTLLRPILVGLAAISLLFTSCKDDDEPASGAEISFTTDAMTIGEGDGTIEVELVLSKPAPRNFRLTYDVGGTAIEGTTATADFDIQGSFGRIDINKGETSAFIEIVVKQDDTSEGDEVIVITLDDVNENGIKIGSDDEITITIADDDDDAPLYTVSFVEAEISKFESDGLIEVEVSINPAPLNDLTIFYELGEEETMALDTLRGFENEIPRMFWDYFVDGVSGELEIAAGETTGKIKIVLGSDLQFEYYEHGSYETITLNLKATNGIQIGENETATINVEQEEGEIIDLSWVNPNYTDVDMDLLLWILDEGNYYLLGQSANASTSIKWETLFIPTAFNNGSFGLSYTYYSGTANPLTFDVAFVHYSDGIFEDVETQQIFQGNYTLENLNEWDTQQAKDLIIAQTFDLTNGAVGDVTPDNIETPEIGSRIRTYSTPKGTLRLNTRPAGKLKNFRL